jgi:hypothetical protein
MVNGAPPTVPRRPVLDSYREGAAARPARGLPNFAAAQQEGPMVGTGIDGRR